MLRLSDAYQVKEEEPRLDLAVVVLNINPGNNKELLDDCQILADYSAYSDRVRTYAKDMELRDAVERAVTECIEEGILEGFLRKNRVEAIEMSIFEYDEEKHMRQVREEGKREAEERTSRLFEDLERAAKNADYRKKLFEEFGL